MYKNMIVSNTGFWQSNEKIYHVCCEPLCDWIAEYLKDQKNKKLYDFGCGNGHYLKRLQNFGFSNLIGFEGKIPQEKEFFNIKQQDLTEPFVLDEQGNCIFFEVAEHIPKQFENIMLDNISNACNNKLIMSWAIRGQDGHGHVNCINNDEAIIKLENKRFKYLSDDTLSARNSIDDNNPYFWFKTTTLIFEKIL